MHSYVLSPETIRFLTGAIATRIANTPYVFRLLPDGDPVKLSPSTVMPGAEDLFELDPEKTNGKHAIIAVIDLVAITIYDEAPVPFTIFKGERVDLHPEGSIVVHTSTNWVGVGDGRLYQGNRIALIPLFYDRPH